jgi:drug/metabolite transporter (DMT)-like permease
MVVFFTIGGVYLLINGTNLPTTTTLIFALVYSVFSALFQLLYTASLKCGPVSLTVMISNFSIGITTLFGILYYKETLTTVNILGFVAITASLLLSADLKSSTKEKISGKWLAMTIVTMILNGVACIVSALHSNMIPEGNNAFMALSYSFGGIFLLIYFLFRRKTEPETIHKNPKTILSMMSVGAVLCVYLPLYLTGVRLFDISIFYPVINAGSSTMISVIGILLFKDKLKPVQIAGLILGTLSIVLLTL